MSKRQDITLVGAYFPTRERIMAKLVPYERLCNRISGWISEVLGQTAHRSTPFVCMDLNDDFDTPEPDM